MESSVTNAVVKLNDGNYVPVVGLGVYQTPPGRVAYNAVLAALRAGYRHVDSAALYGNEADVGKAVRDSGIPRKDIFLTTKLWAMDCKGDGYRFAMEQAEASLRCFGTYVDLYLIHSPHHPSQRLDMWRALEDLTKAGKVRSIGVSNYGVHHLEELINSPRTSMVPAVNQVEIHPFLRREEISSYCASKGIWIQAYSPLAKARKMNDPALVQIGRQYGKSSAQVMIRWSIQKGYITLPKSEDPGRIAENALVFDFALSHADMMALDALDKQIGRAHV